MTVGGAAAAYSVRRYSEGGALQAVGASCSGTVATTSCIESSVPVGRWQYTVLATKGSWSGAESTKSTTVEIAAAPTSVTCSNCHVYGTTSYVNSAIQTAVQLRAAVPATSLATDTAKLTLTDGASHSVSTSAAAPSGAGTVTFPALSTSTFVDGAVTAGAFIAANTGDLSPTTSLALVRDTVAPTGTNIAGSNGAASTAKKADNGDKLAYTFSEPVDPGSVLERLDRFVDDRLGSVHQRRVQRHDRGDRHQPRLGQHPGRLRERRDDVRLVVDGDERQRRHRHPGRLRARGVTADERRCQHVQVDAVGERHRSCGKPDVGGRRDPERRQPGELLMASTLRAASGVGAGLVLSLAVGYVLLVLLGLQPMAMSTGSMTRTIPVGSLVVDRTVAPSSLRVGDVISFRKPLGAPGIATHRIIAIQRSNGHVVYRTKGDSNPVADPWAITYGRHLQAHRMVFHAPYLGYLLLYARSRLGIVLLIGYVCFSLAAIVLKVIAASGAPEPARTS